MFKRISSFVFSAAALAAHGAVADAFLSVAPDAESVLVEERFSVQIRLTLTSPLIAERTPALLFPWLPIGEENDKIPIPSAMNPPPAQANQTRIPFAVVFSAQQTSGNSSFSQQRILNAVLPETLEENNGKTTRVYPLAIDFVARKEGEFTFDPVMFQGIVKGADGKPRQITAQSAPITIRVVPPPLENQPASFIGAIGSDMTIEAALDTHTARVGDPLTLKLTVRGATIAPDSLQPPKLSRQTDLTTAFRVYDDSVSAESLPDGKRFTYRIRPLVAGTIEFPPVEAAFFDRDTRAYSIVKSAPVPLQVQATTQITALGGSADESAETLPMPSGLTLNPAGATETTPLTPAARLLWLALGIPLALHAALSLMRLVRRALRALRERRQSSGACGTTLRRLARADAAETLRLIRAWLGKRLDVPAAGLTPPDIARLLAAHGAPHETLCAIIEALEAQLYQAEAETALPAETQKQLRALLPEIDAALAQRRPSCEA